MAIALSTDPLDDRDKVVKWTDRFLIATFLLCALALLVYGVARLLGVA
jgi:hypothetical protein